MKFRLNTLAQSVAAALAFGSFVAAPASADDSKQHDGDKHHFARIAVFSAFSNTDIDTGSVAEIVAASTNGKTLVYTDSASENLGFVDIRDPAAPKAAGVLPMGGEPTSVAVVGPYALVAVNTSPSFIAPSGKLAVVDIKKQKIVTTIDLAGQPDSVAVSPSGRYAAVIIENERDEDLNDGALPQSPTGLLQIVDLLGNPSQWSLRDVTLAGLPGMMHAADAEPEYVDINRNDIAVVTLQENNHIALVDLRDGSIVNHFSAGNVTLSPVDTIDNRRIELVDTASNVPREPDGASWISNDLFATADEGDLDGGSRGFTIFNTDGDVVYTAGNSVEHHMVRIGHYPERRSDAKGNEPENVETGAFGDDKFLFVGSERSSVVLVYKLDANGQPTLVQTLPASTKPEGLLAIPSRNLLIAASEEDFDDAPRDLPYRSGLTIYQRGDTATNYPTVVSSDRTDGTPIPWGALSGLAGDLADSNVMYTVSDSFYTQSRIYRMDVSTKPATITSEIPMTDGDGVMALAAAQLVNDDGTVRVDPEGIAVRADGGFWVASEGDDKPLAFPNQLIRTDSAGVIKQVVGLPASVNARMTSSGFEGVAVVGSGANETVYVAFQRVIKNDLPGHVRIGRYAVASGEWTFFYYPLDPVESPNGGWVGLSEITSVGNDKFVVIERDNQGSADARIKKLYEFSVAGLTPAAEQAGTPVFPVVSKTPAKDLMPVLEATKGQVLEKIEGFTVMSNGDAYVVNDNDGIDDSNGETQLIKLHDFNDND